MENFGYLLILVLLLVVSAGFTIGLTYAPCFASVCSEEFFPHATRIHVAGYYAIVASIGVFLLLRAYLPWAHSISSTYVIRRELPILKKRVSLGGLTLSVWIVALTVATTGFWVDPEETFWALRTDPLNWTDAKIRLAVTGIVGHHCDIILGLLVIPVSRNSILGRAFSLHQSTLLYAHKLLAYTFLIVVVAHGGAYYTFVGTYAAADDSSPRKDAFNIDNPTKTIAESEAQSTYWSYLTLPTGMLAFLVILVITITALPVLRRRSYNTFYSTHIIGSILVFFFSSVHASTDFYFLLPGLLLWVADWALRLFRGDAGGLTKNVTGVLEDAGYGWYRLSLPVSAKFGKQATTGPDGNVEKGSELSHPIQTYEVNIPSISKLENHAFTAAKVGMSSSGPVLLFQRSAPWSPKRKQKKQDKEWTWKVGVAAGSDTPPTDAEDAVEHVEPRKEIEVRVEGPYVPYETTAFRSADSIICTVGGTGLTGAYSLALWWLANRSQESGTRFSLIWTVRHRDTALLREWRELEDKIGTEGNGRITSRVHVSSEDGRVDVGTILREHFGSQDGDEDTRTASKGDSRKAWVYVSGPEGLLRHAEEACVKLEHELRAAKRKTSRGENVAIDSLDHYVAKWEV